MEDDFYSKLDEGKSSQNKKTDSEVIETDTNILEFEFFDSDAVDSSSVKDGKTEVNEMEEEEVLDKIFDAATSGKTKDLSKLIFASYSKDSSEDVLNKTKRDLQYPLKRKSETDVKEQLPKRPYVKTLTFRNVQNTMAPKRREKKQGGEFVQTVSLKSKTANKPVENVSFGNTSVFAQNSNVTMVIEELSAPKTANISSQNGSVKLFRGIVPAVKTHPTLSKTVVKPLIPVQMKQAFPVETVTPPQKVHGVPLKVSPSQHTKIDFSFLNQAVTQAIENCFKAHTECKIKLVLYCNEIPLESFAIFSYDPREPSHPGIERGEDKLTPVDLSNFEKLKKRVSQEKFECLLAEKRMDNSKKVTSGPKDNEYCIDSCHKSVTLLHAKKKMSNIDGKTEQSENIKENNSAETDPDAVKCPEKEESSKEQIEVIDTSNMNDTRKVDFPIKHFVHTSFNIDETRTEGFEMGDPITDKKLGTISTNPPKPSIICIKKTVAELNAENHIKHLKVDSGNVKNKVIDAFIDKSKKNPVVVLHTLKLDSTSSLNAESASGTYKDLTERKQEGEIDNDTKVETMGKADKTHSVQNVVDLSSVIKQESNVMDAENYRYNVVKEEIDVMEEENNISDTVTHENNIVEERNNMSDVAQEEAMESTGKLVIDESVYDPVNNCLVPEIKDSKKKTGKLNVEKAVAQLYECDICFKVFRLKRYVTRHKREVHCAYSYHVTDYPEDITKINPKVIKNRLRAKKEAANKSSKQSHTSNVEESKSENAFIKMLLNKPTEIHNEGKLDDGINDINDDFNEGKTKNRINDLYSLARKEKRGEEFEIYPVYVCEHCGKFYRGRKSLREHFFREHSTDPMQEPLYIFISTNDFSCPICFKTYADPYQLVSHSKEHTNDKEPKCVICGKCYSSVHVLKRHIDTIHRDIRPRPFKCKFCVYAASNRWHLREHLRIHTGDKPFQCPVCKKCFSHQGTMNRHCKVTHKVLAGEPKRLFYPEGDPEGKLGYVNSVNSEKTAKSKENNSPTVLRLNDLTSAHKFIPLVPVGPGIPLKVEKVDGMDVSEVRHCGLLFDGKGRLPHDPAVDNSKSVPIIPSIPWKIVKDEETEINAISTGSSLVDGTGRLQGDGSVDCNKSVPCSSQEVSVKKEIFGDIVIKQEPEDF